MKKIVTVVLKITIDDKNIRSKYPNFSINWDNTDDFIEDMISNIETPMINNVTEKHEDHLKTWGFSIKSMTTKWKKGVRYKYLGEK